MFRQHLSLFLLANLMLVTLGGCVPAPASSSIPPATVEVSSPAVQVATAAPGGPAIEAATATPSPEAGLRPIAVSNVTVEIGVGSPIPVDAFVSGEWPDLCAQLAQITQQFEGNTLEITLLATAADPACPPDYLGLPFRIAIPINVVELPEGEYLVTANGASTTFTVPVTSPSPETSATTPELTEGAVTHYQGPNPYQATPRFDVAYDTTTWEYVEEDGSGRQSQLMHRSLPGCAIWLRAGPVDATQMATVWRAEREWTISQVQPNVILYSAAQGNIDWIFGVLLPEAYSGRGNSNCQDAAEQVIDTFTVVE